MIIAAQIIFFAVVLVSISFHYHGAWLDMIRYSLFLSFSTDPDGTDRTSRSPEIAEAEEEEPRHLSFSNDEEREGRTRSSLLTLRRHSSSFIGIILEPQSPATSVTDNSLSISESCRFSTNS